METALEVLSVGGSGRQNRSWPEDVKARIVAETLVPGATVNDVARRYGLPANRISSWRTLARKGRLVLPAPEDPVEFAALVVGPADDGPRSVGPAVTGPEIAFGVIVIRLEVGASAELIASIARALAAGA